MATAPSPSESADRVDPDSEDVVSTGLEELDLGGQPVPELQEVLEDASDEVPGDQDDSAVVTISDLPEEVMVELFKWLSPCELLGLVSRVCKEWLRLSRLGAVWAESRLEYPFLPSVSEVRSEGYRWDLDEEVAKHRHFLADVARVPRVHTLDLQYAAWTGRDFMNEDLEDDYWREGYGDCDEKEEQLTQMTRHEAVAETLLQSLHCVTHLFLSDSFFYWPYDLKAVLVKFREQLQSLSVALKTQLIEYDDGGETILEVIASMKKLRWLDLSDTRLRHPRRPRPPGPRDNALCRGLPALERLGGVKSREALVLDVLRSHGDRLTRIDDCDLVFPDVTLETAQAVGRCSRLRELRVDIHNLVHVEGMTDLRRLIVEVPRGRTPFDGPGAQSVEDVVAFIETSEVLPVVEQVELRRYTYGPDLSPVTLDDPADAVVAALARRCTAVKWLGLYGDGWSRADVGAVATGFAALRVLHVWCGFVTSGRCPSNRYWLNALADADRPLRRLHLWHKCESKQECEDALRRFKERHPGTILDQA